MRHKVDGGGRDEKSICAKLEDVAPATPVLNNLYPPAYNPHSDQ